MFLGTTNLHALLHGSGVIQPYDKTAIKNGAYELSLGDQAFQTDSKWRSVKSLKNNQKICIKPGQFALLLTEETLKIPTDKIAWISIKAGVKFKGLVNVSGFHVDPGFEGKLLFSVYNAGPSTIILSRGSKYFPIWFAELNEKQNYIGEHNKQAAIPNEPVEALSQGKLASPNVLSKRIDKFSRSRWILSAIFTLLIAIMGIVWSRESNLRNAVEFGYAKKANEKVPDSIYSSMEHKFNVLEHQIDSLKKQVKSMTHKRNYYQQSKNTIIIK